MGDVQSTVTVFYHNFGPIMENGGLLKVVWTDPIFVNVDCIIVGGRGPIFCNLLKKENAMICCWKINALILH